MRAAMRGRGAGAGVWLPEGFPSDFARAPGVARVAPSHCPGTAAIARLRQVWGGDILDGGLDAVIEVPLQ